MADTPVPSTQTLVWHYGALLIGTFLGSIYGITILQTILYYHKYSYDPLRWKVLVAIVFVVDTVAMGLIMKTVHYWLVESWGNPEMLTVDPIPLAAEYAITAPLVFIVQCFYINTVRALRTSVIVPLVLFALAVTALVTGLIAPVRAFFITNDLIRHAITGRPTSLSLSSCYCRPSLHYIAFYIARSTALAVDLGVVVAMCIQLRTLTARHAPGSRTVSLLSALALQRGVLQTVVQAGEILVHAIPGGSYLVPTFHVLVSRVYCTSFLSTLMSRDYVLSQSECACAPGTFSSAFDPPQLSIMGWEQGTQHEIIALPERNHMHINNDAKYLRSTTVGTLTGSSMALDTV